MIYKNIVVICLLGAAVGSPFRYSEQEYDHYRGPPAPLNPDGTVAFTPEYEHIRDEHSALFDLEYNRVKNNVDASEPYSTKFRTYDDGKYSSEQETSEEDEGFYNPKIYEEKYSRQYDDGQYRPHLYEPERADDDQYNSSPSAQSTAHQPSYVPATINPDGTVAHTPEYNAIASSFLNYHQVLSRHRRSAERYQGPPAPLNHDFTVDFTPEVKHFQAAHFTAVANQFKRLHETAALAAAHPDRTSPPSKDYNPLNGGQHDLFTPHQHQSLHFARKKRSSFGQYIAHQPKTRHYDDGQYKPHSLKHDDGQYKPHSLKHDDGQYRPHSLKHDDGQYRPHSHYHYHGQYKPQIHQAADYNSAPYRPAPLNADGTVAHIPEYHTIAASHLAAHHQALSHVSH